MARLTADTILDWWRHITWHAGKSHVLCRISRHQFKWCVGTGCRSSRRMGFMCETHFSPYVGDHCLAWFRNRQVSNCFASILKRLTIRNKIFRPRLGPMLHRVVGTGTLYFVLACVESYLRVMHAKNDPSNRILVASIPLAVLDSAICWWIFTSLVQTTRTLRLRRFRWLKFYGATREINRCIYCRNMVKLALYRHFTNTLIFAVIASVIFMLFSIKTHRLSKCLQVRFQLQSEIWKNRLIFSSKIELERTLARRSILACAVLDATFCYNDPVATNKQQSKIRFYTAIGQSGGWRWR